MLRGLSISFFSSLLLILVVFGTVVIVKPKINTKVKALITKYLQEQINSQVTQIKPNYNEQVKDISIIYTGVIFFFE